MTIAEFISKYNNSSTGLFKDNSSRDIDESDVRALVADIATLTDIPIDLTDDFWPLSGTAALTDDVVIDGDNFNLVFGSPDSLNSFSLYTDSNIYLDVSDGVDGSYFDFGVTTAEITLYDGSFSSQMFLSGSGLELITDDGVDTSSLTLGPTGLLIDFIAGGATEITGNWTLDGGVGVDLSFGIGFGVNRFTDFEIGVTDTFFVNVDAISIFTITTELFNFLGSPIGLPVFTVATLPTPTDAGWFAFCSDEGGGQVPVFSDDVGNWRRVTDGNIAST